MASPRDVLGKDPPTAETSCSVGPGGREIAVYYVHKESTGAITRQVIDILTLNADW